MDVYNIISIYIFYPIILTSVANHDIIIVLEDNFSGHLDELVQENSQV